MVKHIWKMIWNQRGSNGWIFLELLLVFGGLWAMMDSMLVSWYIYRQPLGFDITNVYKINIGKKSAGIPGYQPDSLLATSEGEDLIRLVENIRRAEEVDEICVASTSCPYTWSNMWSQRVRADADTSVKANYYQCFEVTLPYFDVLRIKDREGHQLRPVVEKNVGTLAVSSDFEKELFEGESCVGKQLKWFAKSTETETIAAVTSPIRQNEFKVSTPCFYQLMRTDEEVAEWVSRRKAENMDCLVRMKNGFKADEDGCLLRQDGRATGSEQPVCLLRDPVGRAASCDPERAVGQFEEENGFGRLHAGERLLWHRRHLLAADAIPPGRTRVTVGIGASQGILKRYLDVEGLSLLAFTVPLVLVFIVNILYFDLPDTGRMAYSGGASLVTFGWCVPVAGRYDLGRYLVPGTQDCEDESGRGFTL